MRSATTNKKPDIIYICSNDGSDPRINKELRTLSAAFTITFVGIGNNRNASFGRIYCKYFYLISGKRNRPSTMWKQFICVAKCMWKHSYHSVHIINEQLMFFFYPLMFRKHVVLDIFDSIFFRLSKTGNAWGWLKRFIYAPVDVIIVTDDTRKSLMPHFVQNKICVLENFPNRLIEGAPKKRRDNVTIMYYGWLGENRGTAIIRKLLSAKNPPHVITAGWIADDASKALLEYPTVDYRGILLQQEALEIAATEADYILCVYAPVNENNIYASPNKVYDSIQTRTPVIINADVFIAQFIAENHLGYVLPGYNVEDPDTCLQTLLSERDSYVFKNEIIDQYIWENIEHILIDAHCV